MLDLICTIPKYCLLLAVVRLLSTVFNLEFGISRQYLRLLEWIFELGQERMKKVDSEHKLHLESCLGRCQANDDEGGGGSGSSGCTQGSPGAISKRPNELRVLRPIECNGNGGEQTSANGNKLEPLVVGERRRRRAKENGFELETADWASTVAASESKAQRMRRVSTPDGPPVFLLDDLEDELDEFCASRTAKDMQEQHEFHMEDATRFVVRGVAAIIDDQVTKRFTPEQLKTWNLLTRTNARNYQFMSRSLGLCWLFGLMARYIILLPLRIMFTLMGFLWLICSMALVGLLPERLRDKPYTLTSLMAFRMLSCGITSRLKFHNRQFRAKRGDICVANHTSPIDVVLMACDNCYALVGQRHGGLLGLLERALSRATNHVWFDRGEMRDRQLVTERLKQHVSKKSNLPVLIFPEGTCINNSAVMMFRKGAFETTDRVCPVAIKYDPRFGDPFWNSSKQSYLQYLLMMMSSWAVKCDVWYLEPMERLTNESSAEFANRVKAEIARQGGLVDLAWDGQLKRSSVKPAWLYQQQEDYVKRLKLE